MSNIVGGAVGAAGVAVLAPTVGAAQGAKNGGLVGGIMGLTGRCDTIAKVSCCFIAHELMTSPSFIILGGAVVGVVGAVGFAVGGEFFVSSEY